MVHAMGWWRSMRYTVVSHEVPLGGPFGHGVCSRLHHGITYSTHETIHGIETHMVTSMGHPILTSMAHSVGSIIA